MSEDKLISPEEVFALDESRPDTTDGNYLLEMLEDQEWTAAHREAIRMFDYYKRIGVSVKNKTEWIKWSERAKCFLESI